LGRRTQGLLRDADFKSAKDVDALDLIASVAACTRFAVSSRLRAAINLAIYQHAKTSRFVERPLDIPESTCVADSKRAIAKLAAMARAKEISLDAANDLIAQESKFLEAEIGGDLEAQMAELKTTVARLEAANATAPNMVVIGGLPSPLPGCNIDMPKLGPPEPDPGDSSS
jgi:hypothetical protein